MTIYFGDEEIVGKNIEEILISSRTGVIFIQLKSGIKLMERYDTKEELLERTSIIMLSMK